MITDKDLNNRKFNTVFTQDDADWENLPKPTWKNKNEIEKYLNSNARHAVVLFGELCIKYEPPLYIIRGASEELNNFYWGSMPAEDPNDAEGGYLTSAAAINQATEEYHQ